nr:MAG TPA: hypothetical protein [Caudoviricetes sp.]
MLDLVHQFLYLINITKTAPQGAVFVCPKSH